MSRNGNGGGRRRERNNEEEEEYEVDELRDSGKSSRGSRLSLVANELGLESTRRKFSRENLIYGLRDLSQGLVIHPTNRFIMLSFSLAHL